MGLKKDVIVLIYNMSNSLIFEIHYTVCDINARPSPVILAPGEYTFSPTVPAGRVYIYSKASSAICSVTSRVSPKASKRHGTMTL